jgi:hypothetical protein
MNSITCCTNTLIDIPLSSCCIQLKAKERVLRDKEAELLDLQSTFERKRQENDASNEALVVSALDARAAAVSQTGVRVLCACKAHIQLAAMVLATTP